jgi:hypothetical protein
MSEFNLKTNSIVGNSESDVTLPNGVTIPSGETLTVNGNVNLTGASTVGFLTATNGSVIGILTATSFVGDGSGLVGLQVASPSKSIALKYIISDPPLRS